MKYNITPVPKPRMTQCDKFTKRNCTSKYWAFKAECRLRKVTVKNGQHVTFFIPMPKSWTKKKKAEKVGTLHDQKPDVDNLCKALLDAVYDDDSIIGDIRITKLWSEAGSISIVDP